MASLSLAPLLITGTCPCRSSCKLPKRVICRAQSSSSPESSEIFTGVYGPWSIDANDLREVFLYRAGLITSATAFVTAASAAFLPQESALSSIVSSYEDALFVLGAGSLGLSLLLIHIYVTPLKRTLQLLWALGVIGSIAVATRFAAPAEQSLVQFVVDNPLAVWGVGPLFAALTGLVFKEGLCYGKLEAAILFFVIPVLLLGHLSGGMDEAVKKDLLAVWMILYAVFAGRKFTQPVKDDIGDKSIFMFNALPESEQAAILRAREAQDNTTDASD